MKQGVIAKVALFFLTSLPSVSLASYEKQYDISSKSYVNPQIARCIFSAKKSGDLSFKILSRSVTSKTCFSAAGMGNDPIDQFMKMMKDESFVGDKGERVSSILLDTSPRSVSGTVA